MQRYFLDFNEQDQFIHITDDDFHHIKNVMRMKVDDAVYLSNNKKVFYAVIKEFGEKEVTLELQYEVKNNSELPIEVTIAQGLPKSDKFELVIQKTTELGVSKLIPVSSERTIVKLDKKKESKKIERYKKIAKEASEQSHRVKIPTITSVVSLKQLIKISEGYQHKLVAYEATNEEEKNNFYQTMKQLNKNDRILVFIGPEGGISSKELELLKEHDFKVISLGNRILRTETAPIFLMSSIVYELELKG